MSARSLVILFAIGIAVVAILAAVVAAAIALIAALWHALFLEPWG
jgi:K+-sensing histidine kinase KdpD